MYDGMHISDRRAKLKRLFLCMIATSLVGYTLRAQSSSSAMTELRTAPWGYEAVKANLIKASEKLTDADYAYKASPDVRSIAELFGHIADVQARLCGMVTGEQTPLNAGKMSAKADLVKALKASFDVCDAAWQKVTDANQNEIVGAGRGAQTRLGELEHVVIHDNEEYGYMAVYMRLRNVVPPSSDHSGH
jgi:uncharacterized damage-inducible protein DinB